MDVTECPIAMPQLVAALPALREMLEPLLTGQAEAAIHMLATPAGVDVEMGFIYLDSRATSTIRVWPRWGRNTAWPA